MSCYHCENASSPEECLQIKVCQPNQLSCETVVRKRDGNIISISKGCKQTESCVNNMFNPINFWTPSECNDEARSHIFYLERLLSPLLTARFLTPDLKPFQNHEKHK